MPGFRIAALSRGRSAAMACSRTVLEVVDYLKSFVCKFAFAVLIIQPLRPPSPLNRDAVLLHQIAEPSVLVRRQVSVVIQNNVLIALRINRAMAALN